MRTATGRTRQAMAGVALALGLGVAAGLSSGQAGTRGGSRWDLADPAAPRDGAVSRVPPRRFQGCALCVEDPGVPIVQLSAADADSLGRLYSRFNQSLVARMDSLFASGQFGPPRDREARRQVHLLTRMLTANSFHYMIGFATDPNHVYEATEETLREAFKKYSDPGLYPIARMKRGRMGLGHICVQYDLSTDVDSTTTVGTQTLRLRVQETDFEGERRRMLIMDLPTILFSVVEVLLAEHFTCRAELIHSNGPPAPYDLYLFHSMEGMYVRKWGTHQPSATMFWATPRDVDRVSLPRIPLVGSCVYVPGVRLELPSFLPDVGFEDLRAVDLPQPILSLSFLQEKRFPRWMRRARVRGFKDWETYGPIPPDLRIRFPDL
ncbi:MAG: hypothetical protein ACE5G2_08995 [Candidatus Krumholzibacteriia bacterium]